MTLKPKKRKIGRLSHADEAAIREGIALGRLPADIATGINRTAETVQAWVDLNLSRPKFSGSDARSDITRALRATRSWQQLKDEFDAREVLVFEEKYCDLVSQFKEDVTPTEETQVFHLIKVELLMSRILCERKLCRDKASRCEKIVDKRLKEYEGDWAKLGEKQRLALERFVKLADEARGDERSRAPEYAKLEEKHQGLIKDLKATRDQRLSRIESAKETFLGLLRKLGNEDERAKEGRHMELMRIAAVKEGERLAQPTLYADGVTDQPILSADTLRGEEGENETQA